MCDCGVNHKVLSNAVARTPVFVSAGYKSRILYILIRSQEEGTTMRKLIATITMVSVVY